MNRTSNNNEIGHEIGRKIEQEIEQKFGQKMAQEISHEIGQETDLKSDILAWVSCVSGGKGERRKPKRDRPSFLFSPSRLPHLKSPLP